MPILGKLAIAAALEFCAWGVAGRDLAPRAYVITPLNSNAITLTYSYYTGGLQCDGALIWSPYSLYSSVFFSIIRPRNPRRRRSSSETELGSTGVFCGLPFGPGYTL
jgi:hypothetical protein